VREWSADLLLSRTGEDVAAWNRRVAEAGLDDEQSLLAAAPALGPVTVQARKTCVSLVSPRRTFAVVQPTTKSRVDLGLRLEDVEPAGRLQAARNVGSHQNIHVALHGHGQDRRSAGRAR
jgi:hypothetical protein